MTSSRSHWSIRSMMSIRTMLLLLLLLVILFLFLLKDSVGDGEYSVAAVETMHHNPRRVPVFKQHLCLTVTLIIVEGDG